MCSAYPMCPQMPDWVPRSFVSSSKVHCSIDTQATLRRSKLAAGYQLRRAIGILIPIGGKVEPTPAVGAPLGTPSDFPSPLSSSLVSPR